MEGGVQITRVGFQVTELRGQLENAARHGGGRAHILGHAAHVKRAAPRLQAGEHVDKAGDQRHNTRTQGSIGADGSHRKPADFSVGTKSRVAVPVKRHQILLVIHPDVRAPSLVFADKPKEAEHAVAQSGFLRRTTPVGGGLFLEFPRQNTDEDHNACQNQNEHGVVQNGQFPGSFRHRRGKQGDRQRNAAQNADDAFHRALVNRRNLHQAKA